MLARRVALLFAVSLTCLSSLAQDKAATPSQDSTQSKSTVYIYRYKQFVGAALAPSVYCDDVQLARMDNGRYFLATVDPGKHTFRSNDPQSGILLDMKPGEQYFIRVEIATGFMKGHGRLNLMSREQASYELVSTKLKPLDADKVVAKGVASVEQAHPQAASVAAAPAVVAPPMPIPATPPEHPVASVTISDGGTGSSSLSGEQTSLGDAARRAREKKRQQQPQQ